MLNSIIVKLPFGMEKIINDELFVMVRYQNIQDSNDIIRTIKFHRYSVLTETVLLSLTGKTNLYLFFFHRNSHSWKHAKIKYEKTDHQSFSWKTWNRSPRKKTVQDADTWCKEGKGELHWMFPLLWTFIKLWHYNQVEIYRQQIPNRR